jgi:tetratricopeptide (TPR) repeat protein
MAEHDPLLQDEHAVVALMQQGRLQDAADRLQHLLAAAQPSQPATCCRLLTLLGAVQIRLGQLEAAVSALRQATTLPDDGYSALQLGNALRYRGDQSGAASALAEALRQAHRFGDGALAITTLCAQGELALDRGQAREAIERFGRALGLTELCNDIGLSIIPLAGLAQAHLGWKNPRKAAGLAHKAVDRAQLAGDRIGQSRGLLSLGLATRDPDILADARQLAAQAPHRPLVVKVMCAELQLTWDDALWREALAAAERYGMEAEQRTLLALGAGHT